MKLLTLQSGVPEKRYERVFPPNIWEDSSNEFYIQLEHLEKWLDYIHKIWSQVNYVWGLNPPEIWQRYFMFEELSQASREMKMMRQAQKDLREAWKSPYKGSWYKKREKQAKLNTDSETNSEAVIQSSDSGADVNVD